MEAWWGQSEATGNNSAPEIGGLASAPQMFVLICRCFNEPYNAKRREGLPLKPREIEDAYRDLVVEWKENVK